MKSKSIQFAPMQDVVEVLQYFPHRDAQCSSSQIFDKLTGHKTTRYALINRIFELGFITYGQQSHGEWSVTRQFILSEKGKAFYDDVFELIAIRNRFDAIMNRK